jgi:hypothetical protein
MTRSPAISRRADVPDPRLSAEPGPAWVLATLVAFIGAGCSSPRALPPQSETEAGSATNGGAHEGRDGGGVVGVGAGGDPMDAPASVEASGPADGTAMQVDGGTVGSGGATVEGGAADAAGADSGFDDAARLTEVGAEAGDASSSPLFFEDFERGTLDPAVWATQYNGGQSGAVVQTANAAHGKYAVQFHANPNVVSYDFIITKNAPAALRGHHFGRAYFYVSPKPPAEHTEFLFAGTAGFPKLKYLEVASIGTAWQLTYVDLTGAAAVESYASGGSIPLARWFCLEWEFNDTPNQATVLVDGQPSFAFGSIASNGKNSGLVGGFADFGFGYYAWHPATYAFDVYYDDIVLDITRVGCLP